MNRILLQELQAGPRGGTTRAKVLRTLELVRGNMFGLDSYYYSQTDVILCNVELNMVGCFHCLVLIFSRLGGMFQGCLPCLESNEARVQNFIVFRFNGNLQTTRGYISVWFQWKSQDQVFLDSHDGVR